MPNSSEQICTFLREHEIGYTSYTHEAVHTVEDAERITGHIEGINAKTLVIFGEKSKKLYLISLEGHKQIEKDRIKALLGERVRFSQVEVLEQVLRTYPGAVSPLGLIFDTKQLIEAYIIDPDILDAQLLTWHPNDNTQTLQFTQQSYQKFLTLIPHSRMRY